MKFIIFIFMLISLSGGAQAATELIFITNADNPVTTMTSSQVRDFYFKRKRTWADGTNVRFIDRTNDSAIRTLFLSRTLKKNSEELDLYWIGQKLYSGESAPLKESTDILTVQFVSTFKGAIGYISAPSQSENIKVIKVVDE